MPPAQREVRIQTPRLLLRPPEREDLEGMQGMGAAPETFRYSDRGPMTGEEAWAWLLRYAGHWSLSGYGAFTIIDRETGSFAGQAGLAEFRRDLGPRFDGFPEITWTVAPEWKGRGYATEAAGAAIRWMEERLSMKRSVCVIHEENAASLRVAEKLGFRPFDERSYRGYCAVLMERLRGASA